MFSARSVRIGLVCGAIAICFAISGHAQDAGKPQEGSNPQSPDKSQEKCCASAAHDAKTGGEQAAPKLSSQELFAAPRRIVLKNAHTHKSQVAYMISHGS